MMFYRASDIDFTIVRETVYDVAIFASGYEKRCAHISRLLDQTKISQALVLGFDDLLNPSQRASNDRHFRERWNASPIVVSANDDTAMLSELATVQCSADRTLRLVVDYSSMSRVWYAGVLNWARFTSIARRIVIDMGYSVGRPLEAVTPAVITDIVAVPGFEGRVLRQGQSVAVFGLGFDEYASLCVLDRLEPDIVLSYYADPGSYKSYGARILERNSEMVLQSRQVLPVPIWSVEETFRKLMELVSPHRRGAVIALVPMGPKPHILASLLVCLREPAVCCLRVTSKRESLDYAEDTGEMVWVRLEFISESES